MHTNAAAAAVLDQQAALIQRVTTPAYVSFLDDYLEDAYAKNKTSTQFARTGAQWAASIALSLLAAEAFYVAPVMTDVIEHAALGLDAESPFLHRVLPAEIGFAWFQKHLSLIDSWGAVSKIRAIDWRVGMSPRNKPGVWVTLWADSSEPGDAMYEQITGDDHPDKYAAIMARLGPIQPVHSDHLAWGSTVGAEFDEVDPAYQAKWGHQVNRAMLTNSEFPDEIPNPWRPILAYWLLMGQTITSVGDADIARPFAKRAKRAGLPPRVTVIELRRRSHEPSGLGERNVEWSHQWFVRGHWAWRVCSEQNPDALPYKDGWGVYVFVSPYVKGPEGAPLLQSNKVYALLR